MNGTSSALALQIPIWLELMAVVVASVSGALTACERRLDIMGAAGLGVICGLGGGLIRDTIMQVHVVYLLEATYAIPTSVAVAVGTYCFRSAFSKLDDLIEWIDVISVGLFAAVGVDKALVYDIAPVQAIFLGLLTANGGGMLRDVFLGDVPNIFRKGNYYALCGLAGAITYWVGVVPLAGNKAIAAAAAVVVTVALRRASLHFNLTTPDSVDLTPAIRRPIEKARVAAKEHLASRRGENTRD